jgi:hypothetical protein
MYIYSFFIFTKNIDYDFLGNKDIILYNLCKDQQ